MENEKLKQATELFLIKDRSILLGYKKRGLGQGYYVGVGGKVEKGETIEEAAIREANEEIGISDPVLIKVADMNFRFPEGPDYGQQVHMYLAYQWEGEPYETEEIKPMWFSFDQIPFHQMWDDSKFWLLAALHGHTMKGEFVFSRDLKIVQVSLTAHKF